MPIKKLVELDGEYGGWLEIDPVKLKRVAIEFKNWLMTVAPENDSFGFLKKDLPLVESALNGLMELPYRGGHPHNWEVREVTSPPYPVTSKLELGGFPAVDLTSF